MDEDTRAAIEALAGQGLTDRILLIVMMAQLMRMTGQPVRTARWMSDAAAAAAGKIDPAIIPFLHEAIAQAMDLAEAGPPGS
jgi:hypothetical protein